jgi:hypothetical protein
MKTIRSNKTGRARRSDSAQATIFVVLALGIFLLGAMGFGVDMTNLWFHRQSAQTAADAACTAGAMDLLADADNHITTQGGFTAGTPFDCAAGSTAAPCQYAALNGYDGANTTPGNQVSVSFPGSVTGVVTPNALLAPTPFIRVDVIDHVKVLFSSLLTASKTQDVRAFAVCGLVSTRAPVPLIILKPNCAQTLQVTGSSGITILGGPTKSIEVNSSDPSAAFITSTGTGVDLTHGGPSFNGSDLGTFGGPSTAPAAFYPGTAGHWLYPSPPIEDPYAQVVAPPLPAISPTNGVAGSGFASPTAVPFHDPVYGCPDNSASVKKPDGTVVAGGCLRYQPGQYTNPINVKDVTAIFDPGLYYLNVSAALLDAQGRGNCGTPGGCIAKPSGQCHYALSVDSNGVVRMSNAVGDTSKGVTFYLSGPGGAGGYGSAFFGSNSGKANGRAIDNFDPSLATCPGGTAPDASLGLPAYPPGLAGDILLGPCTQDGTYFASPTNKSLTGPVRGMVFFQDRSDGNNDGQPSMQGGGGLLISGTMYFHNCPNSPTCVPATDYKAFLQFQGSSGQGTFLLGNITTDEFNTAGTGQLAMQLNPNGYYNVLKVSLLR